MTNVRIPAVAGMFYPADAEKLRQQVLDLLTNTDVRLPIPKAIIAPHAGYIYSGQIAAKAFACLTQAATIIRRVILLGPAHRYPFTGIAAPMADSFATPLGQVRIDHTTIAAATKTTAINVNDAAHAQEHCLEVQLPFLQLVLKEFTLVPLLIGHCSATDVAQALTSLYGGKETLIVVSSDLSHYYDYKTAQSLDKQTAQAILELKSEQLSEESACGRIPIQGLLQLALEKKLQPKLIDLRNSGDTAGPKDRVVGYGAFHFLEQQQ